MKSLILNEQKTKRGKQVFRLYFTIFLILILLSSPTFAFIGKTNLQGDIDLSKLPFHSKVKVYMRIMDAPSVACCVIKNNSIILAESFGYSNLYKREKATLDSIYVIGSNSKAVTSTAIMQLCERGLIDLDDNINDYLPFNISNPNHPDVNITLRMLLAHQSSICDNFGDIGYFFKYLDNRSKWIRERLSVDGELYEDRYWGDYNPGEQNHYSNIGYILVSYLVEVLSDQTFEEYCQENIFVPLKMYNTSFKKETLDYNKLARPYYPLFSSRLFIPLPHYDIGCVAACGGLRTTVIDLSHFLIAHMNKGVWNETRILNESTVEEMHRIQYENSSVEFYSGTIQHGLGWIHMDIYGYEWEGYNGGAVGYSCNMATRKVDNVSIILFSNGHFIRPMGPITMKISDFRFSINAKLGNLFIEEALKNQ